LCIFFSQYLKLVERKLRVFYPHRFFSEKIMTNFGAKCFIVCA
jgi:hypothetical protein